MRSVWERLNQMQMQADEPECLRGYAVGVIAAAAIALIVIDPLGICWAR